MNKVKYHLRLNSQVTCDLIPGMVGCSPKVYGKTNTFR